MPGGGLLRCPAIAEPAADWPGVGDNEKEQSLITVLILKMTAERSKARAVPAGAFMPRVPLTTNAQPAARVRAFAALAHDARQGRILPRARLSRARTAPGAAS
ncbi:hypothetical protein B7P34_05160 [Streptosporangium nondiastaticum]|uniref:Uncharacterized protein n=1 Tax=Streptosporangium nondiastaticum TaxID=35764 RepID=A0A9X7JU11_9ACTN|nr:hypothetical protein [Streptosporangium nondiastaticum]PSJ29895.1 hypothetical protein B7P34_05160 [Streptosporangium nondiastaticum]